MNRPDVPAPKRRRRPVVVRQHSEMDCGAACLATVSLYFGRRFSVTRLRDLIRVGRDGATLANLARGARTLGFEASPRRCPSAALEREALPLVANWQGHHWIVVYRIDAVRVTVADPARGLIDLPRDVFDRSYTGYCLTLRPTPAFAAHPDDRPAIHRLLPHLRGLGRAFLRVLGAAVLAQVVLLALPLFTKVLLDDVIRDGLHKWLAVSVALVVGTTLLGFGLKLIRQELSLLLAAGTELRIVSVVYRHLLSLPLGYFQDRTVGDITSRMQEHERLSAFLTETLTGMLADIVAVLCFALLLIWFSPLLGAIACGIALLHVVVLRVASPRLRHAEAVQFEQAAELESHLIESLKGIEALKSVGALGQARWRYADLFVGRARTDLRIAGIAAWSGVGSETLAQLVSVMVLFVGGMLALGSQMSIGVLTASLMLAGGLVLPMGSLVSAWDETMEALNAIDRLDDVLSQPPEAPSPESPSPASPSLATAAVRRIRLPRLHGALRFDRVVFRHHPDDREDVLQNLTFELDAGDSVCLSGRSGSGKSTVLRLIFGMHAIRSGRILFDGFDLSELDQAHLRRFIGCVPQHPAIFSGSVRDNIALARPGAPLRDIVEAARLAEAAGFIEAMPGGYEARLSEGGGNLSGGQRQRIALARLFLQDPALVLLDEATSALDTVTEGRVLANLAARFQGRTQVSVAHRVPVLRQADRVLVLNRGILVEDGRHDDLIARDGLHARICGTSGRGKTPAIRGGTPALTT